MDKLIKKIKFSGQILLKSGLHIGGNEEGIGIGEIDNPILKHPVTKEPYIPGSSLKGKTRSLLEKMLGYTSKHSRQIPNGPTKDDNVVSALYGKTQKDKEDNNIPSRLIFRDSFLTSKSKKLLEQESTSLPYSEVKMEAIIDRVTSAADPRPIERVPSGVVFDFEVLLNIFESDSDKEEELVKTVLASFKVLNDDYLGGSGSRGSGHIEVDIQKLMDNLQFKTYEDYKSDNTFKKYSFSA